MKKITTKESQYNFLLDLKERKGINQLGLMMSQSGMMTLEGLHLFCHATNSLQKCWKGNEIF